MINLVLNFFEDFDYIPQITLVNEIVLGKCKT
jgi:hypothetical protein